MVAPFFFMQAWKAAIEPDELLLELPPPQPAVSRTAQAAAVRPISRAGLTARGAEI